MASRLRIVHGVEIANVAGWRIASVDHTRDKCPWVWWWGPSNGGYDDSLDHAGVYELDALLAQPDYYGRTNNLCVPDYVARRVAGGRDRARNITATWEALWLVGLFRFTKPGWPAPYDPTPVNQQAKSFNTRFPVGSTVRVVSDKVRDLVVRSAARNIDDRAVVQLVGLGMVNVGCCYDPATTCKVCGDYLLDKWTLENSSDEYAGKKIGDCRSCKVATGVADNA